MSRMAYSGEFGIAIRASAPHRVDCGNALDLEPLSALLCDSGPCTLNIAIGPRVAVTLVPRADKKVAIDLVEFESYRDIPLDGHLRLPGAVLHHFQMQGVSLHIDAPCPAGMGLGGSGAVAVCAVAVCETWHATRHTPVARPPVDLGRCARLARMLEAAVTPTAVGLQDHLAAAFGGVSLWTWVPNDLVTPFRRWNLSVPPLLTELGRRLLVALTTDLHVDGGMTAAWASELEPGALEVWRATIAQTRNLAKALADADWACAYRSLNQERELRTGRWPHTMTPLVEALCSAAESLGGAARFAGGGRGGAVWALVDPGERDRLIESWAQWSPVGYELFPAAVDSSGLAVEWVEQ